MLDKREQLLIRKTKGYVHISNELYYSDAYQELHLSSRNLLHMLLNERRWKGKGRKRECINNGQIKINQKQFMEIHGYTDETIRRARNQLIEVGLIFITYKGGRCRGDCNEYKILYEAFPARWRTYPEDNWKNEIPKEPNNLVGIKTRWKKGESGRKNNSTLSNDTLNGELLPNE